jgi:6-pyruvoyltetrahydropterin/6-carboxytetrahydropterin synthase
VSYSVVMRHSYETAHRLPHLGTACASIHGHSWQAAVSVTAPSPNGNGTVVEFGIFKRALTEVVIAETRVNTAI